jgi:hypothetical protein
MIHRITICLGWTMKLIARAPIIEAVAVTGDITYHAVNGARSLLLAGPQDRVGEDQSIDTRSCLQNVHSYGSKIL